jgi:UDP-glucose:tetrahydrobiopterin glucosyltransferase
MTKKILLLSTPVGAIGSGLGGGVELTLQNLAQEMQDRGYDLKVVAPKKSHLPGIEVIEIEGNLQIPAQTQSRTAPAILPTNSVLANMWEYARKVQFEYDLLVNFAFDWLPFYLTSFFNVPIAHFISMGSMSESLDLIISKVAQKFPKTLAVCTQSQANTFPFPESFRCLGMGCGIDLSLYEFCAQPGQSLAWVGRIAPEKALEDAVAASQITGIPLRIFGKIQDDHYWQQISRDYPQAPLEYVGFLSTDRLQKELGKSQALLMTPRWVEAFGNVVIEALACGVPVISYARGGPTEIVKEGKTGFLVQPDSIEGLVAAIKRIPDIDRFACRQQAENEYSLKVWGDKFEVWFEDILG